MSNPQLTDDERSRIKSAPNDLVDIYFDIDGNLIQLDFSGRIVDGRVTIPFACKSDGVAAFMETVGALAPTRT